MISGSVGQRMWIEIVQAVLIMFGSLGLSQCAPVKIWLPIFILGIILLLLYRSWEHSCSGLWHAPLVGAWLTLVMSVMQLSRHYREPDPSISAQKWTVLLLLVPPVFCAMELSTIQELCLLSDNVDVPWWTTSSRNWANLYAAGGLFAFLLLMKHHRRNFFSQNFGTNAELQQERNVVKMLMVLASQYLIVSLLLDVAQLGMSIANFYGVHLGDLVLEFNYFWTGVDFMSSSVAIYACYSFPQFLAEQLDSRNVKPERKFWSAKGIIIMSGTGEIIVRTVIWSLDSAVDLFGGEDAVKKKISEMVISLLRVASALITACLHGWAYPPSGVPKCLKRVARAFEASAQACMQAFRNSLGQA